MVDVDRLVARTREFVHREALPLDDEFDGDIEAAGGEGTRLRLQAAARAEGLLTPHGPVEYGGLGLNMSERAAVLEQAGYSLFGPVAMNVNAPDEGNIHLLDHVATGAQRERFLKPLVQGEIRSAFAMTEPPPGAGADPDALATRATRVSGGWVINGLKRFITGADGAGVFIIVARTSGEPGDRGGATMFLAAAGEKGDGGAGGIEIVRHLHTMDRSMLGGHCEVRFADLFVADEDVLGEVDQGFRNVQVRLGPARMTHVMRWSGAARRAHETAVAYAASRQAFGSRLADLGMAQQLIADNEIDLAATGALLREACAELDSGSRASKSTSITKTFAAEALGRVVDRATQLCGGLGVSSDLPVAKIARELRPFRIYDGPSEVHRWALARRAVRDIADAAGSRPTHPAATGRP